MYPSFSIDFIKIVIFSFLITIFFSLAGWQAGSIYYSLFTEEKKTPAPVYIFPASKVKLTTRKTPAFKKKAAVEKKSSAPEKIIPLKKKESIKPILQETKFTKDPTMIWFIYPLKTVKDNPPDKQNPIFYSIQTGIFKSKINADKNYNYFLGLGYTPVMVALDYQQQVKIYAVRMGKFKDAETAKTALLKFKKREKIDAILTPLYSTKVLIDLCKNSLKE